MNSQKVNSKLFLLVLVFSVVGVTTLQGQTSLDSARNTALNFFRTYDSIPYLSFDVRYTLFSDTVYSDFSYETTRGSYTLSGKKARYTLGDVEYLQNDSILVAVYHRDEQIIVSDPPVQNTGSYVPLRQTLDSLLTAYSSSYDLWVKTTTADPDVDSIGYIRLVRKSADTLGIYNRYVIEYNIERNFITKVEYEFTEPGLGLSSVDEPSEGARLLKNTSRRKTLRIEFLNYRFDNFSDDRYSENNFIWLEDGVYKPVEKYKNYQVYSARN
ncbi:MAG: hypothetical protein HYZ15_03325 [Sphingobacteriales bacterium]|nr:hypothetical protein [Sphingobacteriales bacterium]